MISPLNICSSLPLFFHFLSPFFNSLSLFFYSLSLFFNSLLFVFHSISLFFHCIPLLFLSLPLTCSSFHRVLIIILPTLPSSQSFVLTSRSSLPHKPVHSVPLPFIVPGFVRSPFSLFPYLRFHSCLPFSFLLFKDHRFLPFIPFLFTNSFKHANSALVFHRIFILIFLQYFLFHLSTTNF